jgi:hypothetical protein
MRNKLIAGPFFSDLSMYQKQSQFKRGARLNRIAVLFIRGEMI